MKKVLLHILICLLILDTTSLCQVFRLPFLVIHFTEHKALNQNISFADFLAMHYGGDDLNDDDDEKDMQLPFKKIDAQQALFLFIPAVTSSFVFKNTTWPAKADFGPDRPQVDYSSHIGSLFRPPRT